MTGRHLTVLSPSKLQVTAPAHYAAQVDVRVKTAAGTSAKNSHDRFNYQIEHTIASGYATRAR